MTTENNIPKKEDVIVSDGVITNDDIQNLRVVIDWAIKGVAPDRQKILQLLQFEQMFINKLSKLKDHGLE